jgi:beta-glucosidase
MKKIQKMALALFLFLPWGLNPLRAQPARDADIEKRADSILKKMTLEEKVDYIGGIDSFYIRSMPRLGLPKIRMSDGPIGVRCYGPSTAYAAGIALAASWDEGLARRVGEMIGKDARARGVHILLGPGVNIYRAPMNGRNFEYFGEDPFLASRIAVDYIEGVQSQGVCATIKHFMGNNSEFDRHHSSSDMDERTMREIYLPTFEAAVKEAHVGAIMDSYNLVNGTHSTQNDELNNQIAKKEWGFDGIMMSDWDATYDGVAAANGGLDLEMPWAKFMNRENLLPAIKEEKVTMATLDDKVRRILRTAIRFGWLDRDQTDLSWPLYPDEGRKVALESAESSMVLLKNEGSLLPLSADKVKTVAVIGPGAYPAQPAGGGSARVQPFTWVCYLQALSDFLSGSATVLYKRGLTPLAETCSSTTYAIDPQGKAAGLKGEYFNNQDMSGTPAFTRVDAHINFNWDGPNAWPGGSLSAYSARWTGYFIPPQSGLYRLAVQDYGLDEYRLYLDGKKLLDRQGHAQPLTVKELRLEGGKAYALRLEYVHHDHHSYLGLGLAPTEQVIDPEALALAKRADVAVVCVGFDPSNEGEGFDRTFELPYGQDELIQAVESVNPNTVVVVTSGEAVDMRKWVDKTPALLEAWYSGQEGGTALADILFGKVNPSGKLPATFDRRWEDNAACNSYYPDAQNHIRYSEGVFEGYRHYDRTKIKPLFPFGYGLSYTSFKYGGLIVTPDSLEGDGPVTVSFDLTNSGDREGAEIAEVYVGDGHAPLPRPVKELKGFVKVNLKPGETKRVEVPLNRRSFSYFDEKSGQWQAAPGDFDILVGPSSARIELKRKMKLSS